MKRSAGEEQVQEQEQVSGITVVQVPGVGLAEAIIHELGPCGGECWVCLRCQDWADRWGSIQPGELLGLPAGVVVPAELEHEVRGCLPATQ